MKTLITLAATAGIALTACGGDKPVDQAANLAAATETLTYIKAREVWNTKITSVDRATICVEYFKGEAGVRSKLDMDPAMKDAFMQVISEDCK